MLLVQRHKRPQPFIEDSILCSAELTVSISRIEKKIMTTGTRLFNVSGFLKFCRPRKFAGRGANAWHM